MPPECAPDVLMKVEDLAEAIKGGSAPSVTVTPSGSPAPPGRTYSDPACGGTVADVSLETFARIINRASAHVVASRGARPRARRASRTFGS